MKQPCPVQNGVTGVTSLNSENTRRFLKMLEKVDQQLLEEISPSGVKPWELLLYKVKGKETHVRGDLILEGPKTRAPTINDTAEIRSKLLLPDYNDPQRPLVDCFRHQVTDLITEAKGLTEKILENIFRVILALSVTLPKLKNVYYKQNFSKHFQTSCSHGPYRPHSFLTPDLQRKWLSLLAGLRNAWEKQKMLSQSMAFTRNCNPSVVNSTALEMFVRTLTSYAFTTDKIEGTRGPRSHNTEAVDSLKIESLIKSSKLAHVIGTALLVILGLRPSEVITREEEEEKGKKEKGFFLYPLNEVGQNIDPQSLQPFFGENVEPELEKTLSILNRNIVQKANDLSLALHKLLLRARQPDCSFAALQTALNSHRKEYMRICELLGRDRLGQVYRQTVVCAVNKKRGNKKTMYTRNVNWVSSYDVICLHVLFCNLTKGQSPRNTHRGVARSAEALLKIAVVRKDESMKGGPSCLRAVYAEVQYCKNEGRLRYPRKVTYQRVLSHENHTSAQFYDTIRFVEDKPEIQTEDVITKRELEARGFVTRQDVHQMLEDYYKKVVQQFLKNKQERKKPFGRIAAFDALIEDYHKRVVQERKKPFGRKAAFDARQKAFGEVLNEGSQMQFYDHLTEEERDQWLEEVLKEAFERAGAPYSKATLNGVFEELKKLHRDGGDFRPTNCTMQQYLDHFASAYDLARKPDPRKVRDTTA